MSNSADFCITGLRESFLKIWAMAIRSPFLRSNQHSFPTDQILACDRETSELAMLTQPSSMHLSQVCPDNGLTKGNATMETWKQENTA